MPEQEELEAVLIPTLFNQHPALFISVSIPLTIMFRSPCHYLCVLNGSFTTVSQLFSISRSEFLIWNEGHPACLFSSLDTTALLASTTWTKTPLSSLYSAPNPLGEIMALFPTSSWSRHCSSPRCYLIGCRYNGSFFPNGKHFVVSGGNFSVTHIHHAGPGHPPGGAQHSLVEKPCYQSSDNFRVIPLGDLNLLHTIEYPDVICGVRRPRGRVSLS